MDSCLFCMPEVGRLQRQLRIYFACSISSIKPLNPNELGTIITFFRYSRNHRKSAHSLQGVTYVDYTEAALLRFWVCVSPHQYNIGLSTKVGFKCANQHCMNTGLMAYLRYHYIDVLNNNRKTHDIAWQASIYNLCKPRRTWLGPNHALERQLKVDMSINTQPSGSSAINLPPLESQQE